MKKIPTLFERRFENHKVVEVLPIVAPGFEWVLEGEGEATIKMDGSCCAYFDGVFYKRYDAKNGKKPPEGAIPCCDPDPVTGHWPHWLKVTDKPEDRWFKTAFKNTIIYCVGTVPLTMIASLALAIVLNQKVIGRGVFRTLSFFPYVASLVAITAVWKMLFHPSKGPVNNILLNVFNVPQDQLPQWFTGGLVLFSMILFSVWKYMGYYMVIYLAGLQGISSELYEAASLDGANTWQKFRYVTWPQLSSTTFFVVVMLTINCFKVYDIAIMLAGGGSGELTTSATVLVYYIYQKAFIDWDLGYSSSVAMVLFLMVLFVTIIQFRGQAKREKA